jgi:hypothetical protein
MSAIVCGFSSVNAGNLLVQCFPNFLAPRQIFRTTIYRDPHSFTGQKEVVLKRKKYFYLLLNIILQKTRSISHNEACVISALVSGYC